MKKISLRIAKKHLSRDEMRTISGGSGSGNGCVAILHCPGGNEVSCSCSRYGGCHVDLYYVNCCGNTVYCF